MTPQELKEIRSALKMTQPEFAKATGYSLSMIKKLETGYPIGKRQELFFKKFKKKS